LFKEFLDGEKTDKKKAEGWKAKKWYDVVTPDIFGKMSIGTTLRRFFEIGWKSWIHLGELTNDMENKM